MEQRFCLRKMVRGYSLSEQYCSDLDISNCISGVLNIDMFYFIMHGCPFERRVVNLLEKIGKR